MSSESKKQLCRNCHKNNAKMFGYCDECADLFKAVRPGAGRDDSASTGTPTHVPTPPPIQHPCTSCGKESMINRLGTWYCRDHFVPYY